MKFLFVYPVTPPNFDIFGIQQGIASLSAVLKKDGHETRLYAHFEYHEDEIDEVVEQFRPDMAGFYVTYPQADLAMRMAARLKRHHGVPVVFGGIWPTTQGEEAMACPDIFAIARGEGEVSLRQLVKRVDQGKPYTDLKGFWFRTDDGEIIRNAEPPYVHDLDKLPFPDRTIFEGQRWLTTLPYWEFTGQRGCPVGCTNCFHHSWMRNLHGDKGYVRFKSPEYLEQEIRETMRDFPLRQGDPCIGFHDPTFTLERDWAVAVCKILKDIGVPWWCNTRASHMDAEIAHIMADAGCFEIHIGIESGDAWIRNTVLKKDVTDEQIINAFGWCKDAGMLTFGFNMLGLPYETEESIRKTVELNRQILPDTVFCSVFNPFPGTDLHDLVVEKGWLSDRKVKSYFEHTSVLDQPSVDARVVAHYHKFFRLMVRHPKVAAGLRPLDKVRINGGHTLYDGFDGVFGQSSRWRKEVIKLMPQSTKDRIKRVLHW
jgi:anaerobic magnesium-protoporphyrin IX monomethyl ester cyclase